MQRTFSIVADSSYVGIVLGHEIAGIIEEFGKDVTEAPLNIGDHVVVCLCVNAVNSRLESSSVFCQI